MNKHSMLKTNTRLTAQLAGDTGTRENNAGIKKLQKYQNIITVTNLEISIRTSGIYF